jgi:tol-pal system protein YbgF
VKSFAKAGLLAISATIALVPASALAQRQPPTPDQRIERLERQVTEMQRQVFPKGRPADTAGFSTEPAATQSSVITLDQRLDSVERQMTDLLRQSEENANRLQQMSADLAKLRSDQEQRITALEQRFSAAAVVAPEQPPVTEPTTPPKATATKPPKTAGTSKGETASVGGPAASTAGATSSGDAGEDAYSEGFHLWEAGNYDQAITSLRAFTAAYPKHKRVSYANNLIGRSLLSKGNAQAAAQTFLANYRGNPSGDRAPDSLLGLGQALMAIGQPGQACKAYQELDAVYGAKIRAELKKQEAEAKTQAQCS